MKLATPFFHDRQSYLRDNTESELKEATPNKFLFLNKIWQALLKVIVNGNELQVWHKSDRSGHSEWHAYDPATGRHVSASSDTEMRIWIEEQYYQ
ncbi:MULTISPECIES: hypothetical protein [Aerosakkonema]|uniref:hypothetical protein n=1 Tax=Aerosakkonema TaxID=1246629 RepID=UPI0035B7D152